MFSQAAEALAVDQRRPRDRPGAREAARRAARRLPDRGQRRAGEGKHLHASPPCRGRCRGPARRPIRPCSRRPSRHVASSWWTTTSTPPGRSPSSSPSTGTRRTWRTTDRRRSKSARRLRPDVAILDIGLPGFSGLEVARRLREEPSLAGLFLVALSGWVQPEDLVRSREAGFDHHLAKPVDVATLERLLARAEATPRTT